MRRSTISVLLAASLLSLSGWATAASLPQLAQPAVPSIPVVLGDSAVELSGAWKFHTGDNAAWAQIDFDDANWGTIDLTPPPGSADPNLGTSGFIPGWTEQGYAGYSGYAWYRLRVRVEGAHESLALKMPGIFDDAYQVFVNGQPIGHFGKFTDDNVTVYSALPQGYPLPHGAQSGPMTIAIRMWMDSATPLIVPDAGGLHGPPVLGQASVIATQVRLDWDDIAHDVGVGFLEALVLLLALVVALTHFWMEPTDKAYLWLALVSLATLLGNAVVLLVNFTTWLPQSTEAILLTVLVAPLRIGLWVLFWAYWFRLGPARWLQRATWSLVAVLAMSVLLLRPPLFGTLIPLRSASVLLPVQLLAKLGLAGLLIWITYKGIRRRRLEGWMALPAVLLGVVASYQHELRLLHIRASFYVFGFHVTLGTASTMLSLLLVTMMLSRRFLRSQRRQVRLGWEVEQAREVQRVLIPETLPQVAGLRIDGDYRPAREVGGDFFQIMPIASDGSVLLVVGDVTGKGLCAGMLVALIVGVLQTAADLNPDPAYVLETLNERLCERAHSSATCVILRISTDGQITSANAGHLPPYLNGTEVPMEGALPLGTLRGITFPVDHFQLRPGDTLMLMSDGVAEAQNHEGQLFGFDRISCLLREPISAAALATAAQSFGQEDDILVLRVERTPAAVSSMHAGSLVTMT